MEEVQQLPRLSSPQVLTLNGETPDKYLIYQTSTWTNSAEDSAAVVKVFYKKIDGTSAEVQVVVTAAADLNSPVVDDVNDRLFFVSAGNTKISFIPFTGAAIDPAVVPVDVLTDATGIQNYKISGDGLSLIYSTEIQNPDVSLPANDNYAIYDNLMVNHWGTWNSHKLSVLKYIRLKLADGTPIKAPIRLEHESVDNNGNTPVPPFGGAEMYDISYDGTRVAFTFAPTKEEATVTEWKIYVALVTISETDFMVASITDPPQKEATVTEWKIYVALVTLSETDFMVASITDLSTNTVVNAVGRTQNPRFASNAASDASGTVVYFQYMPKKHLESDKLVLASFNLAATPEQTAVVKLNDDYDFGTGDFILHNMVKDTAVPTFALFSIVFDGSVELRAMKISATAAERKIIEVSSFDESAKTNFSKSIPIYIEKDVANKKIITYILESSDLQPPKVSSYTFSDWTLDIAAKVTVTKNADIHDPNPTFATTFNIPKEEKFHFENKRSTKENPITSQGWVIHPTKVVAGKKNPVAYLIHGGPEGAWENAWNTRWNPLLWAAKGYVTVMVNPEGSTGNGQDYVDAVRNHWGDWPYQTLLDGFNAAKKQFTEGETKQNWDFTNACAAGASFGGYMVNWIQGKNKVEGTEEDQFHFKCLVTHDGVFSTVNMFYITDELWFPLAEYCDEPTKCTPFDGKTRENFTKFSPEEYISNWNTPHLVVHGSQDLRIPVSEGISAFTALQMRGVPSKFLHFPQENHWVLKSKNAITWQSTIVDWMNTYTEWN
eukprot:CAMPEP_0170535722 /NCGR_PEP_ID=MMETSP0209-20121228/101753_1 /TAXON_ID=665100 ORGANISM="Litonotus pictus, Strain P1" /NCGR_SAMPLE_ID=MMETSP0209 /ASSEMBLY_ACC=CAM_ASM_000301 /LENGTH=776 /DNA_ID=CAMNT_0010837019 /DNA_START=141 /DNA_END=2472 /DNA_ORIENTATION=+